MSQAPSSAQLEMYTHKHTCASYVQHINSVFTIPQGTVILYVHLELHKLYVTSITCIHEQALLT